MLPVSSSGVTWVPAEAVPWLVVIKGLVALVGTVLFIVHMMRRWSTVGGLGQRFRYYALLAASILITGASGEQATELASDDFVLAYRHLGSLVVSLLLLAAAVVSIREGRNPPDRCEPR